MGLAVNNSLPGNKTSSLKTDQRTAWHLLPGISVGKVPGRGWGSRSCWPPAWPELGRCSSIPAAGTSLPLSCYVSWVMSLNLLGFGSHQMGIIFLFPVLAFSLRPENGMSLAVHSTPSTPGSAASALSSSHHPLPQPRWASVP